MILDGWGYVENGAHNAIFAAKTPHWDDWWRSQPHTLLNASGHMIGLPDQQMGNSEVGHMHIGAGRIIPQDFTRINQSIDSGEFFKNPTILRTLDDMKTSNKTLHLMGLLSPGGVHSHENHLFALLALCYQQKFYSVRLHLFLDGRDCPPQSALASIEALNQCLAKYPVATINSITGRYFAMDRDSRWMRVEPVYRLLCEGQSDRHFPDAETAIKTFYRESISDEFIPPTSIGGKTSIQDGDSVFFFNFRSDRARQLTQAFVQTDFSYFPRPNPPKLAHFISMTQYAKNLPTECAFPPSTLHNTLGDLIAKQGLRQLRVAETEKYAHVTFFFNGGSEQVFDGEDRILIPSPSVATYDLQPEMSAPELTRRLIDAIDNQAYDVIICNYANADMVGHTGNFNATVRAIECLDTCMNDVWRALKNKGGAMVITADHGNAEIMFDDTTQQAHTAHTCQPVPFLFLGEHWQATGEIGSLIDVAPTLLAILGIDQPADMTGHSLLVADHYDTK
jgi:2,3-bisphosphoglycerate-independent phosphoglycerate mutase